MNLCSDAACFLQSIFLWHTLEGSCLTALCLNYPAVQLRRKNAKSPSLRFKMVCSVAFPTVQNHLWKWISSYVRHSQAFFQLVTTVVRPKTKDSNIALSLSILCPSTGVDHFIGVICLCYCCTFIDNFKLARRVDGCQIVLCSMIMALD